MNRMNFNTMLHDHVERFLAGTDEVKSKNRGDNVRRMRQVFQEVNQIVKETIRDATETASTAAAATACEQFLERFDQ
jgi:hypothetical protein